MTTNMISIGQVIQLLEDALRPESDLAASIKRVQEIVWNREPVATKSDDGWAVLRDVAHDLDFFVADPKARAEDPTYFGEDHARNEIRAALDRLRFLR